MKFNKGAFLLEIAIGISIIGIMSGFFIAKQISLNRISREQTTKKNIELVAESIASFVASNYRIPRPSAENGIESTDPSVFIGDIPYNTIGIPEKNTLDGRGRPLKYIVEPELTTCIELMPSQEELFSQFDNRDDEFCKDIIQPKIAIANQDSSKDPVAFVIDTADAKISTTDDRVVVVPTAHTFWIRRAMLLIHYIKVSPYQQERSTNVSNASGDIY